MTVRGIGVDLVQIPRMREVIARWQERFLERVFTDAEIAYCRARRDPVPHFAARFAAKEAALKALGTGLRMGVRWRELEVRRDRGQPPTLLLHGRCRELSRERAVSVVHPIKDLHVTILHLLGLDDNKLTYFHGGRFKQLSQTGGELIAELIG